MQPYYRQMVRAYRPHTSSIDHRKDRTVWKKYELKIDGLYKNIYYPLMIKFTFQRSFWDDRNRTAAWPKVPRPRVEWSRHQRSTLLSPRFFQEDECLAVNTAKEYGEDYTCRATNSFGLMETVTTAIATKLMVL